MDIDKSIKVVFILGIAMAIALSILIATSPYFLNIIPIFKDFTWVAFLLVLLFGIVLFVVGYKLFY